MSGTTEAPVGRDALVSGDGLYRYWLVRRWGRGHHVLWVMLNPSTADASKDDPTIRKCIGFSQRWGFGSLVVVNLFAFRATNPKALRGAADPIGPNNDAHIVGEAKRAARVVVAWGAHGGYLGRDRRVLSLLAPDLAPATPRTPTLCLGGTKDGHPRHPLYIPYEFEPVEFRSVPRGI